MKDYDGSAQNGEFHDYDGLVPDYFRFQVKGVRYELREIDEKDNIYLKKRSMSGIRMSKDGTVSMGDVERIAEADARQVAQSCYEVETDKKVPFDTVIGWRSDVVADLAERSRRLNRVKEHGLEREQLKAALALDEAPITFDRLASYFRELEGEQYDRIRHWFNPDATEAAKN